MANWIRCGKVHYKDFLKQKFCEVSHICTDEAFRGEQSLSIYWGHSYWSSNLLKTQLMQNLQTGCQNK